MRFLAPALLLLPLMSWATPQFETHKTMDGGVVYCATKADIGKKGYRLEDTQVSVSSKAVDTLDFTFGPNFYICAQGANGPEWKTSDVTEFLSREVQTDRGLVKIVPVYYKWVVYSQNYKELNPDPNITLKNSGTVYSVNVSDLLGGEEKSRNRTTASRGIITVFLKSVRHAIYPNGEVLNLGLEASSSFNIVITVPAP